LNDLEPLPMAFVMLLCGLDAAQAMTVMVAKTKPDVMLAQLTQLFLDTHRSVPVTKSFGDILAGQQRSVRVFSAALSYSRKELNFYKSFNWVTEVNPNVIGRQSARMSEDLEWGMGQQYDKDYGMEPPTSKARGARPLEGRADTSGGSAASSSSGAAGSRGVSGTRASAERHEAPPTIYRPPHVLRVPRVAERRKGDLRNGDHPVRHWLVESRSTKALLPKRRRKLVLGGGDENPMEQKQAMSPKENGAAARGRPRSELPGRSCTNF